MSTPPSAVQQVFNTVELLTSILLRLDMKTLLLACQRVSKTFKSTIENSPYFWFRPQAPFPFSPSLRHVSLTVNPLFSKLINNSLTSPVAGISPFAHPTHGTKAEVIVYYEDGIWNAKGGSWERMYVARSEERSHKVYMCGQNSKGRDTSVRFVVEPVEFVLMGVKEEGLGSLTVGELVADVRGRLESEGSGK